MRVAAVVVTYNRRDLLLESLAAVLAQTRAPDKVIVVDNASEDGTAAAVRDKFPAVHLAELRRNSGGAGGFAGGMALALADGADLIWLMDDDTVPEPGALSALLSARDRMAAQPRGAAQPALPRPSLPRSLAGPRAGRQPGAVDRRARAPDEHPAAQAVRGQGRAAGRRRRGLRADPLGVVRVDPGRRGRMPAARPAQGRLLPVERRLRVHHPAAARQHRTALPGQRRGAQDQDVRLDRRRPRRPVLLRGTEQGLDVQGPGAAGPAGAGHVRRVHAAPLGPHVRPLPDRRTLRQSLFRGLSAGVRTSPRPNGRGCSWRRPDAGLLVRGARPGRIDRRGCCSRTGRVLGPRAVAVSDADGPPRAGSAGWLPRAPLRVRG